jgi:DNA-binding CsgD family transcriptional regulator
MDEALEELRPADAADPAALKLSDREKEILGLLAKGYTNPQIAEALFLSPETIKWYRKKLLAKFDASTSAALVSKAKDLGLV